MPGLLYTQKKIRDVSIMQRAVTALLHAAQCNSTSVAPTSTKRTRHLKTSFITGCDKSEDANTWLAAVIYHIPALWLLKMLHALQRSDQGADIPVCSSNLICLLYQYCRDYTSFKLPCACVHVVESFATNKQANSCEGQGDHHACHPVCSAVTTTQPLSECRADWAVKLHLEVVLFAVTCHTKYDASQHQLPKQAQAVHRKLTCRPNE